MRRVRTLVAGTALGFAALGLTVPVAHADSYAASSDSSAEKTWSDSEGGKSEDGKSLEGKSEEGKAEEGKAEEHKAEEHKAEEGKDDEKKPHGGPHAGVGVFDSDGAGLAAGGALIVGGLGLAAYAVRRRPESGGAQTA